MDFQTPDFHLGRLYLHPTLPEALTVEGLSPDSVDPSSQGILGPGTLTRWSLETTPAIPLLQRPIYFDMFEYTFNGQLVTGSGGLSAPLDDGSFALIHSHPRSRSRDYLHDLIFEVCQWQDLSTVRTIPFPINLYCACSPACSPDGRWLVANQANVLTLFDRLSGEVMSYHPMQSDDIAALAFDRTSRFVAGILSSQGGGGLLLWKLDPIEHFISHSNKSWIGRETIEHIRGKVALSSLHSKLSMELSSDRLMEGYDFAGDVAFSPDSHMVVFSLSLGKELLIAYEVLSGRLLWSTDLEDRLHTPFIFAPGGNLLITSNMNSELMCYRSSDGSLLQRVPTGLGKPIDAFAFDHDGTSLWLVSDRMLVRYPLSLDLQDVAS